MLTKKELYEQHELKHGENAVSESAFRKRLSSGRSVKQAIETPKSESNAEFRQRKQEERKERYDNKEVKI
ncbi:MAG: hypothetical protein LBG52_04280 [Candidatus Peribacteria bacterium]|jgi:hypothetical protein|nr:hypothetical protein [Candidatus Peribacteria bacterium]